MGKKMKLNADWLEEEGTIDDDEEVKYESKYDEHVFFHLIDGACCEELHKHTAKKINYLLNRNLCKTCRSEPKPKCCIRCKAKQESIRKKLLGV